MWKKLSAWMGSLTAKYVQPLLSKIGSLAKWKRELIRYGAIGIVLGAVVGYLFYRQWPFCLAFAVLGAIGVPWALFSSIKEKYALAIGKEFRSFAESVSTQLRAGRSLDTALRELSQDGKEVRSSGEASYSYKYLSEPLSVMRVDLSAGISAEKAFATFASHLGIEEAYSLSEVLGLAKRTDGNLGEIFIRSARLIAERMDVEEQIRLQLIQKKWEQRVLWIMPFVVLILLKCMAPDYLNVLYETFVGRCVMSLALVIMASSYFLSQRFSRVKVSS